MPPPLLGPTVRLPLAGSYFDVVRGLAGLGAAKFDKNKKYEIYYILLSKAILYN